MLSLSTVTKRYGALTALDQVSLEIHAGECFGMLGPNGAGKSTLMSLIAGLRQPDAGELRLNQRTVTARDRAARLELGLVPQHLALY